MPSVSPIKKSPVTKYLLDNKYYISKGEGSPFTKAGSLYFYGQNNEFLGEMTVHHKSYEIEVSKTIFEKKMKPIYREYIRVRTKMRSFWSNKNANVDKFLPIAYTTTKMTIDLKNKTKTKQVIERVLEKEPELIKEFKETYGDEIYELDNQIFKYKIKSVSEETKPYKWGKYSKYSVFI